MVFMKGFIPLCVAMESGFLGLGVWGSGFTTQGLSSTPI